MITATQKSKRMFEIICPVKKADRCAQFPTWIEPSERAGLQPVMEWLETCECGYQLMDSGCNTNLWIQKIKFFSDTPATQFKLTWC